MATKNTTKSGSKSTVAKKTTTAKKSTGTKSTAAKASGTKSNTTKSNAAKSNTTKNTVVKQNGKNTSKTVHTKPVVKEELVPELSNELILLITLVVSLLLFLSNFSLSGKVGEFINQVTFGLFGILAYLIPFFLFFGIAFYLANRDSNKRYIVKLAASIGLFVVVAAVLQLVFGETTEVEFLEYYKICASEKNGGGLIGGALCWVLTPLFGKVGSYVVLIALALLCIMILTGKALFALLAELGGKEMEKQKELHKIRTEERAVQREEQRILREEQLIQREEELRIRKEEQEKIRVSKAQSFLLPTPEEKKEEAPKVELKRNFFGGFSKTAPAGQEADTVVKNDSTSVESCSGMEEQVPMDKATEKLIYTGNFQPSKDTMETVNSIYEEELRKKFDRAGQKTAVREVSPIREVTPIHKVVPTQAVTPVLPETKKTEEPFEPSFSEQALQDKRRPESPVAKEAFSHAAYGVPTKKMTAEEKKELEELKEANKATAEDIAQVAEAAEAAREEKLPEYQFPPIELLSRPVAKSTGNSEEELQQTADKLKSTLESFGVRVAINNVSRGPSVTRYELQPEQGVKVSKITGLADDIKLNLAAADVRIEAPIPGKAAVGIEVPNKENTAVLLRELIECPEFVNHSSNIAFTVGKDIGGQNIVADIGKMPHLLIAGATGSGKSVCINTIIMSILYKAHPNDVKLIMVDPKVVELSVYNGIPHLLIPVVTDPKKASAALNWAVAEMMERYEKFAALGVRDLKGYNERVEEAAKEGLAEEKFPKLPQIVIIVDELADLMMVAPGEVEDAICRLAQLARAAGLHLIIATQRPSVNVITGLIKANVPSRVAFAVSSGVDSRTILDTVGAEKLLGKGDMLFYPSGYTKPVRIQGAFVSDKEVGHVVEFLKGQNPGIVGYSEEISKKIASGAVAETAGSPAAASNDNGKDEYFAEAGRFIIEKDKASIGMLQRVYKIGFNRAARIMDQLSEAGVVGPEEGTKPRKILMTLEEFENYLAGGQ